MKQFKLFGFLALLGIGFAACSNITKNEITTTTNRFFHEVNMLKNMNAYSGVTEDAVVFVGSSSIKMWDTLSNDMAPIPVVNNGFGGSTFEDAILYVSNLVWIYEPEILVLYEGDNDFVSGFDADEIFTNYLTFLDLVWAKLPETEIVVLSIKPSPSRMYKWDVASNANAQIRSHTQSDERLSFIDVSAAMLNDNGECHANIFKEDLLHMNEEGYAIWTELIKPKLQELYDE